MSHAHDHNHSVPLTGVGKAFVIGIVLNIVFVVVQLTIGIRINSLSLISDAGHNFADVASLVLSLVAFQLTKVKPNDRFTYGYRKTSVLIALVNSVILLISLGVIGFEAIQRFFHPTVVPGKLVAWVAVAGVVVNGVSAFFFFRNKERDLNIKSAFLHLLADALISLAIVAGGIIMYFTGQYWIDPLLSLVIAIVILISTWRLLSDSMKLSLDAVPENVSVELIRKEMNEIKGIVNIHHLHIWAISTTENAMTGHLVLEDSTSINREQEIKTLLKNLLLHHNIHHITLETEREAFSCERKEC